MMKDVMIHINSIYNYALGDEDSLEFSTDGHYLYDGEVGCLSYMESEVTGMEGTRTSMIVMPEQVVVDRDGAVSSRMVFKAGEKNSVLYNTPFGSATMSIDTKRISHSLGESGGSVEIDYVVDMEHNILTRNRFQITVKQIGEQING